MNTNLYAWERDRGANVLFHIIYSYDVLALCGAVRPNKAFVRNNLYPGTKVYLEVCCPVCVAKFNELALDEAVLDEAALDEGANTP
jgi:hypothetical protein